MGWLSGIFGRKAQKEGISDVVKEEVKVEVREEVVDVVHEIKEEKPKAIVFIDYEHWYYSYQKLYGLKPDPVQWRQGLDTGIYIEDIMVFADFSHKGIQEEIGKLRSLTNTIIETQQAFSHYKKDMTDFIMLDYIYRYVIDHPGVSTYILVTGDGHFQSVVKYLLHKQEKRVIIYGVKDAFSNQLKHTGAECIQMPADGDVLKEYYKFIVQNLSYVAEKPNIIPTFMGTVNAVSARYSVPEELVHAALNEMMNKKLVYQMEQKVAFNKKVNVIKANWDKLVECGLWSYG